MNLLLIAILFFVLSPGILVTIPPGKKGLFFSGQTSLHSAIFHAIVFVIACCILHKYIKLYEGFDHCNEDCDQYCNQGCNEDCSNNTPEIKECPKPKPKPKPAPACKPPPTEKELNCISKKERTWSDFFFGEPGKIYSV